jgi:hypothetical protein
MRALLREWRRFASTMADVICEIICATALRRTGLVFRRWLVAATVRREISRAKVIGQERGIFSQSHVLLVRSREHSHNLVSYSSGAGSILTFWCPICQEQGIFS